MRAGIIINPNAGRQRGLSPESRARLAEDALRECDVEGSVAFTQEVGSAGSLARGMIKQGVTTLVAWGGDGTVNEVASATARAGLNFGIVPGGSGNGLARELGIERRPADALRTALRGTKKLIDMGEISGRMFTNVAGVGFDAHLAGVFNTLARRGRAAYIRSGFRELLAYDPVEYTLEAGNVTVRRRAFVVAVANGRQYGGGAVIAPSAKLDDGRLEVVVLPLRSLGAALWQARRLFTGTIDCIPGVQMFTVDRATLSADRPLTYHVDGEVFEGERSLKVKVLPRALCVRVPPRG